VARPAGGEDGAGARASCAQVATGSNKENGMADNVPRVDYLYLTVLSSQARFSVVSSWRCCGTPWW
jgi:hypothetical protein